MAKYPEGDQEEGEIIDDDDFEEISDNSIIYHETGKSLSPKEYLPVISLSSVSEAEYDDCKMLKRKRFKRYDDDDDHHHHHHHHHGRHRHHHHQPVPWKRKMKGKFFEPFHKKKKWKRLMNNSSTSSSSSDSESSFDLELDRKLQHQLKAAIRVQTYEDSYKNSLQSRLRAMTQIDVIETKIEKEKSNNNVEEKKDVEELDDELIQLRLEALKTAVLNKFEHRKKRKVKEIENSTENVKTTNLETNKENTGNENIQVNKPCLDKPDIDVTPPDEDEDVLRALLLASMSKKITKDIGMEKVHLPHTIQPKQNQSISKTSIFIKQNGLPLRQHVPPKIKPIIININSDSETDDDKKKSTSVNINDKIVKDPVLPVQKINREIESTVERFLKEQRAKVEAQSLTKKTIASVSLRPNSIKPKKPDDSVILEKSAVKLLPKVKQIEYHKLLQRLKNAQKMPRIRKVSEKNKEEVNSIKRIVKNKLHPVKSVVNKVEKVTDIKQDAKILHNALKQMQKENNGRLQIEEKYVILTPIIRKINEATTERKAYDQDVKRLFAELAEAKAKLYATHRNFSTYVRELLIKKQEIDKSSLQQTQMNNDKSKEPNTSTPIKVNISIDSLDLSTVPNTPSSTSTLSPKIPPKLNNQKSPTNSNSSIDTTMNIFEKIENQIKDNDKIYPEKEEFILNINEMDTVCNRNSDVEDINPGDPNDIHKIYKNRQVVPKYISPLDSFKRDIGLDPFVIMCPFDIDGNCRDPECTYKHYSR